MSGGTKLRKRQTRDPFVQVASRVVRDERLSFRARGLLVYLLDLPDGWDVRSENLAARTTEGREAVRTALRELAKRGHYRLERQQRTNGRWEMGTAVSEYPVAAWAEQSAEYGFKAVTVIEQPDGSFMVKRKDGSLTDDGFDRPSAAGLDVHVGRGGAGDGFLGPRAFGDGFPDAGEPGAGRPDHGLLGASYKTKTSYTEVPEVPPASAPPRTPDEKTEVTSAPAGSRTRQRRVPEAQARFEMAGDIATRWWARCAELGIPNIRKSGGTSTGFPGFRSMLERALEAGCTELELKLALEALREPFPSLKTLERAIIRVRQHRQGIRPARLSNSGPLDSEACAGDGLGAVFE